MAATKIPTAPARDQNCEKRGAPSDIFARRIPKFFGSGVQRRSALPWRVMAGNPDAMMVPPGPMARDPIPPHPAIPIPGPVVVIGTIANRHVNPERFRRPRDHDACAHQRGQQHRKFIFHNGVLSLSLLLTDPRRILFGGPPFKQDARP